MKIMNQKARELKLEKAISYTSLKASSVPGPSRKRLEKSIHLIKKSRMLKNIIFIIIILVVGLAWFRYFEWRSIFFPTREFSYTPEAFGMEY